MEQSKFNKQFGRHVQHLRRISQLTQEQLAGQTDLSVETVSKIERGLSSVRMETAFSLAAAFSVSLPELFQFDDLPEHRNSSRKEIRHIMKLLSQCPAERLPEVMSIVQQAIQLTRD